MDYAPEDQVTRRLTAKEVGRTKLHLNVTVPGIIANCHKKNTLIYSSSLEIEVFEALQIISPPGVSGVPILMAPFSTVKLRSNMDSITKLRFR